MDKIDEESFSSDDDESLADPEKNDKKWNFKLLL